MGRFGTPAAEVNDSSGDYLRNLKGGDTKVRFLQEIPVWTGYYEHFLGKQSFPCTGDRMTCPGCVHDNPEVQKATRRWGTNLLLVESGAVVAMKLPSTLKKKCENRAARNDGSITSRDYILIKEGNGMETTYDIDQDEKYRVNLEDYDESLQDIEEILASMFDEVFGEGTSEEYLAGKVAPPVKEAKPARKRETVDDQIDEWAKEGKVESKRAPRKTAAKKPEPEPKDDTEVTEEGLREMTLLQLVQLADSEDVDINGLKDAEEIIQAILVAAVPY